MLLEARDLKIQFAGVNIVEGVSLAIPRRRTVALVGESGCGKSLTALALMGLVPAPGVVSGGIMLRDAFSWEATDLMRSSQRGWRRVRGGRIAMVFQDPMNSLNPVLRIGEQIVEAIRLHRPLKKRQAWERAVGLLGQVGIPSPTERIRAFPHQLSGGQRQRVMIAMALASEPSLLIADEPTTALDSTTQDRILALLQSQQERLGLSLLLITHDLEVVSKVAHEAYVMYAGRIVEQGRVESLLRSPLHPYTRGLLGCVPRRGQRVERLATIPGSVPAADSMPDGCRFHPRCPLTRERAANPDRAAVTLDSTDHQISVLRRCVESYTGEASGVPPLGEGGRSHRVACWESGAGPA